MAEIEKEFPEMRCFPLTVSQTGPERIAVSSRREVIATSTKTGRRFSSYAVDK